MPKRRWWQRRTRQRQLGRVLYVGAAVLVVIGIVTVINDGSGAQTVVDADQVTLPPATSPTIPPLSTTAVTEPTAGGALDANAPPEIFATGEFAAARSGVTPVPPFAVLDIEAEANDATLGVILYSPTGVIHIGSTTGLQIFEPNPGQWIPIIGRQSVINAALRTVAYEPRSSAARQEFTIIASDFGGSAKASPQRVKRTIVVLVS